MSLFLYIEMPQRQFNIESKGELIFSEPNEESLIVEELKWHLRSPEGEKFFIGIGDEDFDELIVKI